MEVRLRGTSVDCVENTIRIGDVADIKFGSPAQRRKLAMLDLDEFSESRTQVEISARQIRYRLLIAGLEESAFRVIGPPAIVANLSQPFDARQFIEQSMMKQLSDQFQLPESALEVSVNSPVVDLAIARAELDRKSLVMKANFPIELPLGIQTIEVQISDAQGRSLTTRVPTKVSIYRDLVMAKENISRGDVLSADKIEIVRRPVNSQQIRFASYQQSVGKQAQTHIQQFSIVKTQSLRSVKQQPAIAKSNKPELVVKRGDRVNVISHIGNLKVTLRDARALGQGEVGDYVDFTNSKTKQTVRARIVNAVTAVIEL